MCTRRWKTSTWLSDGTFACSLATSFSFYSEKITTANTRWRHMTKQCCYIQKSPKPSEYDIQTEKEKWQWTTTENNYRRTTVARRKKTFIIWLLYDNCKLVYSGKKTSKASSSLKKAVTSCDASNGPMADPKIHQDSLLSETAIKRVSQSGDHADTAGVLS